MNFYQKKSLPPIKFVSKEEGTILPIEIEEIPHLCCQDFDLFNVATSFFELERKLLEGIKIKSVIMPITETTYNKIDTEKAAIILKDLSTFIFQDSIEFRFEPFSFYQSTLEQSSQKYDAVCLFSGGADSFVGILQANKSYNNVLGLYIHHKSSNKLSSLVEAVKKQLREIEKIKIERIKVNPQIKNGYSQTRGLLYLICGGIYANRYGSSTLILSECGVTIYQPSFGELDKTTYTSHPRVRSAANNLFEVFIGNDMEIITPFENNTKSEMFALSEKKDLLQLTHSCITSRYNGNVGTCYGCLIRRIGFIVADIKDCDYYYDIFTLKDDEHLTEAGNIEGKSRINDFLGLMNFSLDILVNYDNMDYTKIKKIVTYDKYDLFRRFALDTFAALYIIIEENNTSINARIKKKYLDSMNYIDKQLLIDRISEVRSLKMDETIYSA